MSTSINERVSTKIFLGIPLNSELKLLVSKNIDWMETDLTQIHYDNKEYIGMYLPGKQITFEAIKDYEDRLHDRVKGFFPDQKYTVQLFSQLFIK